MGGGSSHKEEIELGASGNSSYQKEKNEGQVGKINSLIRA